MTTTWQSGLRKTKILSFIVQYNPLSEINAMVSFSSVEVKSTKEQRMHKYLRHTLQKRLEHFDVQIRSLDHDAIMIAYLLR